MKVLYLLPGNQGDEIGGLLAVDEVVVVYHQQGGLGILGLTDEPHNLGKLRGVLGKAQVHETLGQLGVLLFDLGVHPLPAVGQGPAGPQKGQPDGVQVLGVHILPERRGLSETHRGPDNRQRIGKYLVQLPVDPGAGQDLRTKNVQYYHPSLLKLSDLLSTAAGPAIFFRPETPENAVFCRRAIFC